jgi:hypothetical protein
MVCYFGDQLGVLFDDLLNQKVNQLLVGDLPLERKVLGDDAFDRFLVVSLPAKLVAKFLRPFIDKARNFALFDPVFWTGWRG